MCPHDQRAEPDITFAFGRDATAARAARRALQPLFAAEDAFAEDVRLVASELVSNVVLHTAGGGRLAAWGNGIIRLEVHDGDPTLPAIRSDPSANGGRGLSIVSGIADRWGARTCPDGKTLWAEIRRPIA